MRERDASPSFIKKINNKRESKEKGRRIELHNGGMPREQGLLEPLYKNVECNPP